MAKKEPIEFWFDFSSPYGYIASTQIDDIADEHDRSVVWRPFLLGPVMKASGGAPLANFPMKFDYLKKDVERFARLYGIDFTLPDPFPIGPVAASRAFYWLERQDAEKAKTFAAVLYDAYFGKGRDIGQADVVLDVAAKMGIDRAAMEEGIGSQDIKDALRAICDQAVERGIFGSPWIIVDGESFWGADRLWMVEEWLDAGGW